jgi:hypothetical protein
MVVPLRKEGAAADIHIRALEDLDALVSEHVMGERPAVHWEDSYAHFQFESLDEALEAMRDPVFKEFIPAEQRNSLVVEEVKEFRPYSSQLGLAWEVIERLGAENVRIERAGESWRVAFGRVGESEAATAAVAICVAALRARGLDVVVEKNLASRR